MSAIATATFAAVHSAQVPHITPTQRQVEIEQKLPWLQGLESVLSSIGFQETSVTSFCDVYVDDDQTTLTSLDCWLRRRDSTWELKLNAQRLREFTSQSSPSSSSATIVSDHAASVDLSRYEEYTKEEDILQFLQTIYTAATNSSPHTALTRSLLAEVQTNLSQADLSPAVDPNFWKEKSNLTKFLHDKEIKPIVVFTTNRRTFEFQSNISTTAPPPQELKDLPLHKCHIVLDEADYAPPSSPSTSSSSQNTSTATNTSTSAASPEHRFFRVAEVEMVFNSPSAEEQHVGEKQISTFVDFLRRATRVVPDETKDSHDGEVKLPRGKVERYLALFRPWHFELLRKIKEVLIRSKSRS